MIYIRFVVSLSLLVSVFSAGTLFAYQNPPQKESGKQAPAANPSAALTALKQAIETGDVAAFANLTAGGPGVTLRKLVVPMKKAQDASSKLDRALAEKPV